MKISEKVAIIAGGASGLGWASAEALLAAGAKVAVFDLQDLSVDAKQKYSADVLCRFAVDVTDEASVTQALTAVLEKWQAVHVLLNCAGIGAAARTVGREGAMPLAYFSKVVTINLIGSFNVLRLVAEKMQHNAPDNDDGEKGVIINTASVAAFDGQIGQVAYSASKGGVVGMTLPLARDLAPLGIRVNTIAPGIFNTPLMNASPDKVKIPLIEMTQFPKRLGHPSEYAKMVLHLIDNSFMNGETIRLDGAIRMAPR